MLHKALFMIPHHTLDFTTHTKRQVVEEEEERTASDEVSLKTTKTAKKLCPLTPQHKIARIAFATKWLALNLGNVLWSDETMVRSHPHSRKLRHRYSPYDDHCSSTNLRDSR